MNSETLLLLLGAFAAGAATTLGLTPPIMRVAKRFGLVDRPDARRVHQGEVPRLGGVAIFMGLLLGSLTYALFFGGDVLVRLLSDHELQAFLAPCAIVWLIGLVDDVRGLSPAPRIAAVAIAATMLMQAGYVIDVVATPWGPLELGYATFPVTLLWFVGVTNAFNLVDGLDGLLATVAIPALLGCAAVGLIDGMRGTPLLAVALAGALTGFLCWNWHPARVFMGDSGSLLVGFTTAALTLKVSRNLAGAVSLHIPIALCALPICETCLTLARRHVRGTPYLVGDRSHIHHVMLNKGLSVPRTVLTLAGASALLASVAVLSRFYRTTGALVTIGLLLIAIVGGLRWLGYVEARVLWDRLKRDLLRRRRRGVPEVLALIRAGDLVRSADSMATLRTLLGQAAREAGLCFLVVEPGAGCRLEPPRWVEGEGPAAARYLAERGAEEALWLFSVGVADPASKPHDEQRLRLALPPGSGRLGHMICQRRVSEGARTPHALDVRKYLAEPLAEALARLGASLDEGAAVHEDAAHSRAGEGGRERL